MAAQSYATPAAFNAALKAAAQKTAKANGMPVNQLMDVFYFSRLAARVFAVDPDSWLIKGGQALLVRYAGAARLSRDIDLQCASPETTAEEAAARLVAAAQHDLGDHLRFAPTRFTPPRGGSPRRRAAVRCLPRATEGHPREGRPRRRPDAERRSRAALPGPGGRHRLARGLATARIYPTVDHVADKICAMYEKHPGGAASNRYRDLADLLLISQQETLRGAEAHQALHREAARRARTGIHIELPPTFEVPDTTWRRNYPQQAALVLGLQGCRTLDEAHAAADTFATPLLADTPPVGRWHPQRATWGN